MKISGNLAQLEAQLALLAEHWGQFSEAELRAYPGPGRWSKKEILGHLIDSAANNHHRFVLAQVDVQPRRLVPYDQEAWVRLANYQHLPATELLNIWTSYNHLIMHLLAQITPEQLVTECLSLNNNPVTLAWLIDDYVLHLEHHVGQIIHEQE